MRGYVLVVAMAVLLGCKGETKRSRFQISKPTADSVAARKAIDGEVSALVFADDAELDDQLVGYLEDLGNESGRPFKLRELDVLIDTEEARQYKVVRDAVVLVRGDRSERIEVRTLPARGGSKNDEVVETFDRDVGAALQKLGRVSPTVEIVLAGDEGASKYTVLDQLVTTLGFKRAAAGETPQIMILIDRGAGSIDDALAKVDAHVAAGGSALVALEPVTGRTLGPLGTRLGIRFDAQPLADDKAFAVVRRTAVDHRNVATNSFASHPATTLGGGYASMAAVYVTAGSLEIADGAKPAPLVIVRSQHSTFADPDGNLEQSPGETRREFALAAAVETAPSSPTKGRVLVYSDADWLSDTVLPQVAVEQMLALQALRWLGVQSLIDVPPHRAPGAGTVALTRYPLRKHARPAPAVTTGELWNEPADAIATITLKSKDRDVSIRKTNEGLWGRDERTRAGSAAPDVREYPVDEQIGREVVAGLAKPRSLRALGKVDEARRRELGLDGGDTLVVTGRATHELVLGGRVYGGSDRYALDRATGEAYVLSYEALLKLSGGDLSLRMRSFVPFERAEIARVVVELNGKKRELPVGDVTTAAPGSPEALGAIVADDARVLHPLELVTEAQAGDLASLARIALSSKAGKTTELELLRATGDSSSLFVRDRHGLTRVPATAERLVHTIEQAIATMP